MLSRRSIVSLACAAALCGITVSRPAAAAEPVKVVASFSILADLVRQIGGDRVTVVTLVPVDGDAHVYQPTPQDAKALTEAGLIVFNGLGLESWGPKLVKASGSKATYVEASGAVTPRKAGEQEHGEGGEHHGAFDPHAWQSVANTKRYVGTIRDALAAADPADKAVFETRAADYLTKLDALEADIRRTYAAIPARARRVITTHDAFGYYGAAYGIEFLAPQGMSTETEASAKDVGRLIRQIRKEKIKAVFIENISDPRLVERIAKESGTTLGGALYSDALSPPDGPAATYLEMMRHNLKLISAAMRPTA